MEKKSFNEKRLKELATEKSDWVKWAKWREKNDYWLDRLVPISLKILRHIRHNNIDRKDLSKLCKISEKTMLKILKGQHNITIKEICKIEMALNIRLLEKYYETSC